MLSKNLGFMKNYQNCASLIHIIKPPWVNTILFYLYLLMSLYYLKHVEHSHRWKKKQVRLETKAKLFHFISRLNMQNGNFKFQVKQVNENILNTQIKTTSNCCNL